MGSAAKTLTKLFRMKVFLIFMLLGVTLMEHPGDNLEWKGGNGRRTRIGLSYWTTDTWKLEDWSLCGNGKNGSNSPCGVFKGDCDSDEECAGPLSCGVDNCKQFDEGAHELADCCTFIII